MSSFSCQYSVELLMNHRDIHYVRRRSAVGAFSGYSQGFLRLLEASWVFSVLLRSARVFSRLLYQLPPPGWWNYSPFCYKLTSTSPWPLAEEILVLIEMYLMKVAASMSGNPPADAICSLVCIYWLETPRHKVKWILECIMRRHNFNVIPSYQPLSLI